MPTSSEIQSSERVKNKTNDSESEKQEHLPKMGCENSTEFLMQTNGFSKRIGLGIGIVTPPPNPLRTSKLYHKAAI